MIEFLKTKQFFKHLGLSFLMLCIALWAVFLFLSSYTMHGKTIEVPVLEGLPLEKAAEKLKEVNLNFVVIDSIYNSDLVSGSVVDQNPSKGFNVKLNRTVYLTINSFNPPMVRMPNLIDVSLRQADAMLETYGLKIGTTTYVPDFAKNAVIKQRYKGSEIKSGTEIRGGSKIDLVLGDGLKGEKVPVPSFIGLTVEDANRAILAASLSMGAKIFDSSVKDSLQAKVYRQMPATGNSINMGKSVDLFLTQDPSKIKMPADSSETK